MDEGRRAYERAHFAEEMGLDDQASEQRARLEEMRDLYAFFERELPRLLERWAEERRRTAV